ncbi:MAG: PA0069 family radical SAM protein [bacterium]|nr:PA0069 family radical SAM protein [bacterium]
MEQPEPQWNRPLPVGRGAVGNPAGRFDATEIVPFDDGWGADDPLPPRVETVVTPEASRSILTQNDSPDVPFDQSVNPYKGCEHGCVYCFARPTHSYLGLSPGLDFESRIFSKPHAARLLRDALGKKGYRCRPIALGSNTDPYQPVEKRLRITRSIVETLADLRHPVTIVTKSALILRDLDLLAPMARAGLAMAFVSITTLDRSLARKMEPRAATPQRRLDAVRALRGAGVPTGVLSSPIIPGLNDSELERILEAAADAGAESAAYILLRLPHELKRIFTEWLQRHYPTRAAKVLNQLQEMRGGRLNDPAFGQRMTGGGSYADLLRRRFDVTCRKLGLNERRIDLDTSAFRAPTPRGRQSRLF